MSRQATLHVTRSIGLHLNLSSYLTVGYLYGNMHHNMQHPCFPLRTICLKTAEATKRILLYTRQPTECHADSHTVPRS